MITMTEVVKKIGSSPAESGGYENQFVCDSTIAQFHLYDVWIKLTVLPVCTYVWRMHKKSFFRDSLCKYRVRVVSAHEIGHSVQLGDRPVCARQHFRTKDNFKTSFDLNLRRSGSNAASSYAVLSATGIRAIFFHHVSSKIYTKLPSDKTMYYTYPYIREKYFPRHASCS